MNDTFYEIITSPRYSTPATNRHDGGITFYSTLFSKIAGPEFEGGMILGGKTGFTNEAGQCLASLAVKNGKKYILITSGAGGNNKTQKLHIDDAFSVYTAISK
jgi:D-alanyl-D-alanine carboxypeptidase (penicillin-binding protein 5/6)